MEKPLPENSRRQFLGSLGAAFAALSLPAALSAAQAATDAAGNPIPKKTISNPYIYKFSIGKFEAWSISDGFGTFKQGVTKKMWPQSEQAEMSKALTQLGERPNDMTLYINILLLRKDKEVILIDAGFGPHKNATWGWLADAMETIGIGFDQVTHTLLSHSHIDHIGGLASGGKILFPNAAVHVLKEEVDFWRGKDATSAVRSTRSSPTWSSTRTATRSSTARSRSSPPRAIPTVMRSSASSPTGSPSSTSPTSPTTTC
ncbi:MAG: hypothetical protein RI910_2868 [Verrucomicrobiota bacterium]